MTAGTPVLAQGTQGQNTEAAPDAGAELRQQLANLSANPTSVPALVAAGRAALEIGDASAALSFFSRADELAPGDARVKAGLASANTRTGNPEIGLAQFQQAVQAGAPEIEIAADRGLAYDMTGQPQRAQQDYVASLRRRDDPEVRRRLAMSLAISGQREAGLRVLEPQLRSGDRAGQRARVFVHALSGDMAGAQTAARQAMPAGGADAMMPFLGRMAALDPGHAAAAANLGFFPSAGGVAARAGDPRRVADSSALAFAGMAPVAPAPTQVASASQPSGTRRRPGAAAPNAQPPRFGEVARRLENQPVRQAQRQAQAPAPARSPVTDAGRPSGNVLALSNTNAAVQPTTATSGGAAGSRPFLFPHPFEPLSRGGSGAPSPQATAMASPAQAELAGGQSDAVRMVAQAPAAMIEATNSPTPQAPAPQPAAVLAAASAPAMSGFDATETELASTQATSSQSGAVMASAPSSSYAAAQVGDGAAANLANWNRVGGTTSTYQPPAPRPVVERPAAATPRPAPVRPTATVSTAVRGEVPARTPAPAAARTRTAANVANTSTARVARTASTPRTWVQLGVGARAGMSWQYGQFRSRAARALGDRTAFVSPIGGNVRLLVGPFASDDAADAVIAQLRTAGISALSWTSPPTTAVEPLSGAARAASREPDEDEAPAARSGRTSTARTTPARTTNSRTGASSERSTARTGTAATQRSGARSTATTERTATRGTATRNGQPAARTGTTATGRNAAASNSRSGASATTRAAAGNSRAGTAATRNAPATTGRNASATRSSATTRPTTGTRAAASSTRTNAATTTRATRSATNGATNSATRGSTSTRRGSTSRP